MKNSVTNKQYLSWAVINVNLFFRRENAYIFVKQRVTKTKLFYVPISVSLSVSLNACTQTFYKNTIT